MAGFKHYRAIGFNRLSSEIVTGPAWEKAMNRPVSGRACDTGLREFH
jgi:hypothetical protein